MVNLIHPSSPATKELFNYLNDLRASNGQVIPLVSLVISWQLCSSIHSCVRDHQ